MMLTVATTEAKPAGTVYLDKREQKALKALAGLDRKRFLSHDQYQQSVELSKQQFSGDSAAEALLRHLIDINLKKGGGASE